MESEPVMVAAEEIGVGDRLSHSRGPVQKRDLGVSRVVLWVDGDPHQFDRGAKLMVTHRVRRKTTEADRVLLKKMAHDPPGTVRTTAERIAFEHQWDDRVEAGAQQ